MLTPGLIIESLVVVLLATTIGYCIVLNRRLKRLRADDAALRATIGELITATEFAERAIAGLRVAVSDCEQTLSTKLTEAERSADTLSHHVAAGEKIIQRLSAFAKVAKPVRKAPKAPKPVEAVEAPAVASLDATASSVRAAAEEVSNRLNSYRRARGVAA